MRRIVISILLLALICVAAGCGERDNVTPASSIQVGGAPSEPANTQNASPEQNNSPSEKPEPETLEDKMENTIQATITMQDGAVIVIELYPDLAPQSVRNFVSLARSGFYDGLKFHRIIKGFMIQGGCPDSNGMGNPGYSIFGEFAENGFANDLSHTRGVLSMARGGFDMNSAGSQFFIVHATSPHLNGAYAAFGKVIDGMDVVDALAETPVIDNNGSVAAGNMPVMKSITIDDDIEIPEPEKLGR